MLKEVNILDFLFRKQINQWVKSNTLTENGYNLIFDGLHHEASDDLKHLVTLYALPTAWRIWQPVDFRLWRELFMPIMMRRI